MGIVRRMQLDMYSKTATNRQHEEFFQITFAGESGVDMGGLTREFFHIVFRSLTGDDGPVLHGRQVFHGQHTGSLLPVIDPDLVSARAFWFVGLVSAQVS